MTKSIIEYRRSTEKKLASKLESVRELQEQRTLKLQHVAVNLAFTKNIDTFSVLRVTTGSFEPVSSDDKIAIVLYVTGCESGFGLYDEDNEACLPIDVHEVVETWSDESVAFQQNMLSLLCANIDAIIERSTPATD